MSESVLIKKYTCKNRRTDTLKRDIIELFAQILIDKFSTYIDQELEKMFNLTDEKKQVSLKKLVRIKTVSRLGKKCFPTQEIA